MLISYQLIRIYVHLFITICIISFPSKINSFKKQLSILGISSFQFASNILAKSGPIFVNNFFYKSLYIL